ncbi:hypothetical protein BIW11_10949 [Tropilaelaps mercedesae]|uniref:Uncharacterized protein n=1 Tax=Tropilaelaps mercedesae TaxID=418985 RepID=A0A1V9XDP0_9ACAR|nr:hypothetical protein BIW11_10949 [Tropilaelaps mercedesae]
MQLQPSQFTTTTTLCTTSNTMVANNDLRPTPSLPVNPNANDVRTMFVQQNITEDSHVLQHHFSKPEGKERNTEQDGFHKEDNTTKSHASKQRRQFPQVEKLIQVAEAAEKPQTKAQRQPQPVPALHNISPSLDESILSDTNELYILRLTDILDDVELTEAPDISDIVRLDDSLVDKEARELALSAERILKLNISTHTYDFLGNPIGPRGTFTMRKSYFDCYFYKVVVHILELCEDTLENMDGKQMTVLQSCSKKLSQFADLTLKLLANRGVQVESAEKLYRFAQMLSFIHDSHVAQWRHSIMLDRECLA